MPNVGPLEIAVVLIIALLVLGPKKLPDFGRSVGRGMREFKNALTTSEEPAPVRDEPEQPPAAATAPAPVEAPQAPPRAETSA